MIDPIAIINLQAAFIRFHDAATVSLNELDESVKAIARLQAASAHPILKMPRDTKEQL